jgi:predicted RND superfamily exporter protein
VFSPKQGLALLRMLEEALDTTLEVQADFAKCNPDLVGRQIREAVSNDVMLLLAAVGLIAGFMLVYFRNLAFAILAVFQITISFPMMAFFVDVVLRQRPLSVFSACSLFIVTGVSSDNIFVVHETWQQA